MSESLHDKLLQAHARQDMNALAELYAQAAAEAETNADVDAACFFLTQAYVFALEAGMSVAAEYNRKLAAYGRDDLRPELARINYSEN